MDIIKRPYEISLWKDELTWVGKSGKEYTDSSNLPEEIVNQYYKEVRLCTIGSDTMDTPARCVNPKLVQKVNGENSLTFTMYYQYIDPITGLKTQNPFIEHMANERKIKLRLGPAALTEHDDTCKWFDFIIKNTQENSDSGAFTYTCKDQFVTELSKTGFEIELDNELENNMGTIDVLAESILEGSDWKLDLEGTKPLNQYVEEPLYQIQLNSSIEARQLENPLEVIELGQGDYIYAFYDNIANERDTVQFLYSSIRGDGKSIFATDDDLVIDREQYPNWFIENVTYNEGKPSFALSSFITSEYRGERLVRQRQTKYDSTIDKYVNVYKKKGEDDKYYGYTESEYKTSGATLNYVANPSSFSSTTGWETDSNLLDYTLKTFENEDGSYQTFLACEQLKSGALVKNAGIGGNRAKIKKFTAGEEYILRIKYAREVSSEVKYVDTPAEGFFAKICKYSIDKDSGRYVLGDQYFEFNAIPQPRTNDVEKRFVEDHYEFVYYEPKNYLYFKARCNESISETELKDWDFKVGLFFNFGAENKIYIEDAQVFPYSEYQEQLNDETLTYLCVPNGKLFSEVKTRYIYYKPNNSWKSIEDLITSDSGYEPNPDYVQLYGTESKLSGVTEFTKVRSISGKESNRFNLIQDLCETFECWSRLYAVRNQITGEILRDEDNRQKKFVSFHEYAGEDKSIGFTYGVNSKSIQRTVDSANIVTKMIVKDNANEFAPNGFCSIAQADENTIGENFLIDFSHYYRHKMLDENLVNNDLLLKSGSNLGYFTILKEKNLERDAKIDIQSGLINTISQYEAQYTTYKTSFDSAKEEKILIEQDTAKYLGKDVADNFKKIVTELLEEEYKDDSKLSSYWVKWCQCQNIIESHEELYLNAEYYLNQAKEQYDAITEYLEELAEEKRALALRFYKKYSNFIQEGSWIKEDYTDPNLYYLDAQSVLHTSAMPKVTYSINVVDVSPLKGYEAYQFDIGDKTYVQDVEFFGWSRVNQSVPYRQEVIISEITSELDSPEKEQIKVQNYKNQFEDLFQRITAQTQQAEYHTGEYARAASIVQTDGTIAATAIASSLANNSFKLSNANNQSVVWDRTGLTTTNLNNPSEMIRIIGGGVFLSSDGGQTWRTGISSAGINTAYLTTGQINTDKIYIMNGSVPAFRWDEKGLSAYYQSEGGYSTNKFVRFDHNGLYGILASDEWTGKDEDIHDNASFALTWSGFSLKNENGSVRISTDQDIQVLQDSIERIKIGRLDNTDNPDYGIRIKNADGSTVMETDGEGELWLKDRLHIGDTQFDSMVEIGYLSGVRAGTNKHEVIRAGDSNNSSDTPFVVYEDGRIVANYIEANGGRIGNMTIAQVENAAYEVVITSNKGASMLEGTVVELTAHLYCGGQEITKGLTYQWYTPEGDLSQKTEWKLILEPIDFNGAGYIQYGCRITMSQEENNE